MYWRASQLGLTEPLRFLYLIRFNLYFWTNSNSVRISEHQIQNRNENGLDIFRLFSTFNSEYPEFKILFKPNLALENLYLFYISDEDDFYMKILALSEIYNLLVFSFFIWALYDV